MLLRDAIAHQITQGIYGRIGNLVIHTGPSPLSFDKALLHQHGQVARHIGGCIATRLRQFPDVVLLIAQQIQDAQARGLSQGLKVVGHAIDGLLGKLGHKLIVGLFKRLIN